MQIRRPRRQAYPLVPTFRGAPFTWRKDGTFRVDTEPRFVTARENLNWSIALGESLCQLRELVALGEPKGKP